MYNTVSFQNILEVMNDYTCIPIRSQFYYFLMRKQVRDIYPLPLHCSLYLDATQILRSANGTPLLREQLTPLATAYPCFIMDSHTDLRIAERKL